MSQISVTQALWPLVLRELDKRLPADTFETWFAPLRCLAEGEDTLILGAPHEFAAIWLADNYLDLIRTELSRLANRTVEVTIEVVPEAKAAAAAVRDGVPEARFETQPKGRGEARLSVDGGRVVPINPRNTFENFIVGSSNQLAHAASLAVAKSPGRAYNPLFLYGDTGLGKTHLMHAVAHAIARQGAETRVVYVSCEKFTNEFMRAIQDNSLVKFRKYYRNVDVLLIDDVQFLERKERTQEEFFHTFNELFESGRQICLSSDRPASEIQKLESRLISRFQWGMVTDIQAPDLETRLAILRKKADALNYSLPAEIMQFLAQKVTRNVRRMEGALIKVATTAQLTRETVDLAMVQRLLQDILQEEQQNQITIEKVQKKVVEYYDLRMADMISKRRPNNIAFPRQVAMYLCRILTTHPLKEIGEGFGGRDHGTVIHACKSVENLMEQDDSVRRAVDYLTRQLRQP